MRPVAISELDFSVVVQIQFNLIFTFIGRGRKILTLGQLCIINPQCTYARVTVVVLCVCVCVCVCVTTLTATYLVYMLKSR